MQDATPLTTRTLAHPFGEIAIGSLDHQMIMVAHQAIGVAEPVKALSDMSQRAEEELAVGVVFEDRPLLIAAGSDVIEGAVVFDPQRVSHDGRS